jgi:hypothetical protein
VKFGLFLQRLAVSEFCTEAERGVPILINIIEAD